MTFFLGILMCGSAAMGAWYYWQAVFQGGTPYSAKWFIRWALQGLLVPCVFWILINAGVFWTFGPFMPQVSMARTAGEPWVRLLLFYAGVGLLIIASYWLALSLGWLLGVIWKRVTPENRKDLRTYGLIWGVLLLPISVCLVLGWGWKLAGFGALLPLVAVVHSAMPLLARPQPVGSYSAAIGKLKFGRAQEAEWEILKQLEGAQNDFEGWMLLAEVYATQFKDVDAADQTVREICAQPDVNAGQVNAALHRLADWHLQIAENPVAARETLQILCTAYAGTHLAKMAQLRIDQLPKSRQELREQRQVRTLRLPGLQESSETKGEPEGQQRGPGIWWES